MESLSGPIGNRTRYLPASSAVSQQHARARSETFCNLTSFFTIYVKLQLLVTKKYKCIISLCNLGFTIITSSEIYKIWDLEFQ